MKKIACILIAAAAFTACKKDRTCTCTDSTGTTVSQVTYTNVSKKDAQNNCSANQQTGVTCSVK